MKLTTAAFCGAVLGGLLVLSPLREIWRNDGYEILQWFATAIVSLAIPVGALGGAAFAALFNWMNKGPSE